jgi:hypothetical protein
VTRITTWLDRPEKVQEQRSHQSQTLGSLLRHFSDAAVQISSVGDRQDGVGGMIATRWVRTRRRGGKDRREASSTEPFSLAVKKIKSSRFLRTINRLELQIVDHIGESYVQLLNLS